MGSYFVVNYCNIATKPTNWWVTLTGFAEIINEVVAYVGVTPRTDFYGAVCLGASSLSENDTPRGTLIRRN